MTTTTTMNKLIFDQGSLPFLLKAIGRGLDNDGYVINLETQDFELDQFEQKFKGSDLAMICQHRWYSYNNREIK